MAAVDLSGWIMKDHGVSESKLTVIQKDKKVGVNNIGFVAVNADVKK